MLDLEGPNAQVSGRTRIHAVAGGGSPQDVLEERSLPASATAADDHKDLVEVISASPLKSAR
jgi:hypothetical protein